MCIYVYIVAYVQSHVQIIRLEYCFRDFISPLAIFFQKSALEEMYKRTVQILYLNTVQLNKSYTSHPVKALCHNIYPSSNS